MPRKLKIPPRTTTAADLPPHLKPGAKVEVRSDDPGYLGSWYTGSVIRLLSPEELSKFLVRFTHLFEDEDGEKHLEEVCDAANLRPPAPREKVREFRFSENVDAFYNDGWWEGVISEELENGRFMVFFRNTREQIEFGEEELRLHRDWTNGTWKPHLEKELHNQANGDREYEYDKLVHGERFVEGTRVEVSSDEDGFKGAWFAANIVHFLGRNNYLVQYESLKTDDGRDFLKEVINATHIRPYPPEIVTHHYEELQEVDALHNDGWWEGKVSKVLSNSAYMVYFQTTSEELVYKHSQLRLHQDWIDRKWVVSSQSVGSEAYILLLSPQEKTHHISHLTLKLKKQSNVLAAGLCPFVPGAVLARKVTKQEQENKPITKWLIQWKGYTADEATWESKDEILQMFPDFNP